MASKTVTVGSAVGLHARPAALIAQAAAEYDDAITLQMAGGSAVDAASPMMIMTLGAERGAEVTVASDNADAVEAISSLIERDLSE
jgi:phosphocarrier protein